jgi:tRNA(Arg) A34 adenosine deaminase TadA
MTKQDSEFYINKCIELGNLQMEKGNPPFAAILLLDDEIVVEGYSTVGTDDFILGHSEFNLVTGALEKLTPEEMSRAIMYSNAEPCAMCAGVIFNSGLRHLVYGVPTSALLRYFSDTIALPCRVVFDSCNKKVEVEGPILADKAITQFEQFWGC